MAVLKTLVHLYMEQKDRHAEICIFWWYGNALCINIDIPLHSSRKMPSWNEVKHGKKWRHMYNQGEDLSPSEDRAQEQRSWKRQHWWRGKWPSISYPDQHDVACVKTCLVLSSRISVKPTITSAFPSHGSLHLQRPKKPSRHGWEEG